eukprot:m51a1_g8186 hypothetical protein (561) ;mRNA; r:152065-153943
MATRAGEIVDRVERLVNSVRAALPSETGTARALNSLAQRRSQLPTSERQQLLSAGGPQVIADALRAHAQSASVVEAALRAVVGASVDAMEDQRHAGLRQLQCAGCEALVELLRAGAELREGLAVRSVRRCVSVLSECLGDGPFGADVRGVGAACWALGALFNSPSGLGPAVQEAMRRACGVEAVAAAVRAGLTVPDSETDACATRACAVLEALSACGDPASVARVAQPATVGAVLALLAQDPRGPQEEVQAELLTAQRSAVATLCNVVSLGSAEDRSVALSRGRLMELIARRAEQLDARTAGLACRAVATAASKRDLWCGRQRADCVGVVVRLLERFNSAQGAVVEALGALDTLTDLLERGDLEGGCHDLALRERLCQPQVRHQIEDAIERHAENPLIIDLSRVCLQRIMRAAAGHPGRGGREADVSCPEMERMRAEMETRNQELARVRTEAESRGQELERMRVEAESRNLELERMRAEAARRGQELERARSQAERRDLEIVRAHTELHALSAEVFAGRNQIAMLSSELGQLRDTLRANALRFFVPLPSPFGNPGEPPKK